MKKHKYFLGFITGTLLIVAGNVQANDGAFYAQGNQLIPIRETDIAVKREVLRIERYSQDMIRVNVYYEFSNPGQAKNVLTGFEAKSPSGDVDATPASGKHPYMHDFSVTINGVYQPYQVAIVKDEAYYQNGKFISTPEADLVIDNTNHVDFNYVYYFDAPFKSGINVVEHTYLFRLSGSVMVHYNFLYVLTAANRWANGQIDDFTLLIDMGDFEEFSINTTFFKNCNEWILSGTGKLTPGENPDEGGMEEEHVDIVVQDGLLIFQKDNFKPAGELMLYCMLPLTYGDGFNYQMGDLPFSPAHSDWIGPPTDETSKKILRNLPFARRGYVFKNQVLQDYFSSQVWYIPNPGYEAKPELLPEAEQQWIKKWSN